MILLFAERDPMLLEPILDGVLQMARTAEPCVAEPFWLVLRYLLTRPWPGEGFQAGGFCRDRVFLALSLLKILGVRSFELLIFEWEAEEGSTMLTTCSGEDSEACDARDK